MILAASVNLRVAHGLETGSHSSIESISYQALGSDTATDTDKNSDRNLGDVGGTLLVLLNKFRRDNGLGNLAASSPFGRNRATAHSKLLSQRPQMNVPPNFKTGCFLSSTTLFAQASSVKQMFRALVANHKQVLLSKDFAYVAIGIANRGSAIYATHNFCTVNFVNKVGLVKKDEVGDRAGDIVIAKEQEHRRRFGKKDFNSGRTDLVNFAKQISVNAARAGKFRNRNTLPKCVSYSHESVVISSKVNNPDQIAQSILKELEYRKNESVISNRFTSTAIAIVFRNDNAVFSTQVFCQDKKKY